MKGRSETAKINCATCAVRQAARALKAVAATIRTAIKSVTLINRRVRFSASRSSRPCSSMRRSCCFDSSPASCPICASYTVPNRARLHTPSRWLHLCDLVQIERADCVVPQNLALALRGNRLLQHRIDTPREGSIRMRVVGVPQEIVVADDIHRGLHRGFVAPKRDEEIRFEIFRRPLGEIFVLRVSRSEERRV